MEALASAPAGEGRRGIRPPSYPLGEAVHALAQLPGDVGLEIGCNEGELDRLRLLAWAYGVEQRVELQRTMACNACWLRGADRIPYDHELTLAETVESLLPSDSEVWNPRGHDEVLTGHRIALVTNLPTPYRIPLFRGIARRLEAVGGSLLVLFLSSSPGSRTWLASGDRLDFEHEYVRGFDVPVRHRPPRIPFGLRAALRRHRPTMALSGGLSPLVSGTVERYARSVGIPFGLWSGEIAATAGRQTRARQRQRQRLVRGADFAITYGSLAARYLADQAPDLPVVLARNTSVLTTQARQSRSAPVQLLTVGDLASPRKGVDVIVSALRAIPDARCRLTVVGDGRLRTQLEREAASDERIRFVGALPAGAVAAMYSASEVYLFPSRSDVFGLVLVEAMSRALSTVVSSAVGAVPDVAVAERNCLVLDGHEPAQWADAIARLVDDAELRAKLGEAARKTIALRWTIDHAVEGMMAGLRMGARLGADARRFG